MLPTVNRVTINIGVQGSLWFADLDSSGFISRGGIPGSFDSSVFSVQKKPHTYSAVAAAVYKHFSSLTSSPAFVVICFNQ